MLEISCHGSIIFFRGIGRKVGRSLTLLISVCLFAPDDGEDILDLNYLQTLKAGGRERERERERETSACIRISFNLKKYHVSVLKMILGDASRAHRHLHDKVGHSTVLVLCMLSIACPNVLIDGTLFPEIHSDLIWIRTLTTFLRERGSKYQDPNSDNV